MHIAAILPPEDPAVFESQSGRRWPPAYCYISATVLKNFWVGQEEIDQFTAAVGSPWIAYWTADRHSWLRNLVGRVGLISVYRYGSAPYVQATLISEYYNGQYEAVMNLGDNLLTYTWLSGHPRSASLPGHRRVLQVCLTEWSLGQVESDPDVEIIEAIRRAPAFNK